MVLNLIIAAVSLLVGGGVVLFVTKRMAHTRAKNIIEEAKLEADVLKKNKLLEVKEAELKMKADVEKQANSRMQKIQAAEAKSKQRELQLNQQQSELQRKRNENENMKAVLDQQVAAVEMREQEVEKMQKSVQETLEHISGLSAEEAKEKLVESLKDEAKTAAASYINDIMAKLTANKEAKRIVVQSIQRVATETAIENSVTVFHIDSDEIKGRIIGREGRNIRALETATGCDLIIDDTPEAITLSSFDQTRREVALILCAAK